MSVEVTENLFVGTQENAYSLPSTLCSYTEWSDDERLQERCLWQSEVSAATKGGD